MNNGVGARRFYETDAPDMAFRLGDILNGFYLGAVNLRSPKAGKEDFSISVTCPQYVVLLTPCCSVGNKSVLLTPLIRIPDSYLRNPYLLEDFTRINRVMRPEDAVPPEAWQQMSGEERSRRLEQRKGYAFVEVFVFEPHELLPRYPLQSRDGPHLVGHYMIDFRLMTRVECKNVENTKKVPIEAKVLQLSIPARSQLRDKLTNYFGRVPSEDEV